MPDAPCEVRGAVREWVLDEGYNDEPGAFVQTDGGGNTIDATGLLIPVVRFLSFDDERVQGTIHAVGERPLEDELFVRRHDGDGGLPRDEGACWLVDLLTLSGRIEEAHDRLETLIKCIKPLELVPE